MPFFHSSGHFRFHWKRMERSLDMRQAAKADQEPSWESDSASRNC
jgi:hypothetical protein